MSPIQLNILVACEESQRVCIEFRARGHNAFSCDLFDCSGNHPEWHIKQDVLTLLEGGTFFTCDGKEHIITKWDMIIAFPPCTHLATSGTRYFAAKRSDGRQRTAVEFFCQFLSCSCPLVAIENPVGIMSGNYVRDYFPDLAEQYGLPRKSSQIIKPWMFGDQSTKGTCLWLKGLPPLAPEITEMPEFEYYEWVDQKTGAHKRQTKYEYELSKGSKKERARKRAKTFPGIARAMSWQWGSLGCVEAECKKN